MVRERFNQRLVRGCAAVAVGQHGNYGGRRKLISKGHAWSTVLVTLSLVKLGACRRNTTRHLDLAKRDIMRFAVPRPLIDARVRIDVGLAMSYFAVTSVAPPQGARSWLGW